MSLPEILSAVSALDPSDLEKVKKYCETLIGDQADSGSATSWPAVVWDEVAKQLKRRGLPGRPSRLVLTGKNRQSLEDAAQPMREFLVRVMGTEDDLKLRLGLPLLIDCGLNSMERSGMTLATALIGTVIRDFVASACSAYPGLHSPGHFRRIYKLHRDRSAR